MTNFFNDYFIEIVQISSGPSHLCLPSFPPMLSNEAVLCLQHVDHSKTDKIIQSLSNSKAKDYWGLDISLIKQHREILIPTITQIINKSTYENVFPSVFKTAVVTPIHKSGNKCEIANHRPISL